MNISIYGHGGSANHGNEAIVRGVCKLFNKERITLYSFMPENDRKFGLNEVCEIKHFQTRYKRFSLTHIISHLLNRFARNSFFDFSFNFSPILHKVSGIYLLEAGDQYCENYFLRKLYAFINKQIVKRGGKTVMLGCTINPEVLEITSVREDLKNYSLIIARESITYNALIKAGINKNTILAPCPAFVMDMQPCELPEIFNNSNGVVGINAGFLAQGNHIFYDILLKNCIQLIDYILKKTDMSVGLIPHVNWSYDASDIKTLDLIKKSFANNERVLVVNEHSAPEQKFIMSKCRFMVSLRTHVSVPSIAALIPTLITGYKIKSMGIARDIFPEDMKLLAHVQSLKSEYDFVELFRWMQANEKAINDYMRKEIPEYINKTSLIYEEIKKL